MCLRSLDGAVRLWDLDACATPTGAPPHASAEHVFHAGNSGSTALVPVLAARLRPSSARSPDGDGACPEAAALLRNGEVWIVPLRSATSAHGGGGSGGGGSFGGAGGAAEPWGGARRLLLPGDAAGAFTPRSLAAPSTAADAAAAAVAPAASVMATALCFDGPGSRLLVGTARGEVLAVRLRPRLQRRLPPRRRWRPAGSGPLEDNGGCSSSSSLSDEHAGANDDGGNVGNGDNGSNAVGDAIANAGGEDTGGGGDGDDGATDSSAGRGDAWWPVARLPGGVSSGVRHLRLSPSSSGSGGPSGGGRLLVNADKALRLLALAHFPPPGPPQRPPQRLQPELMPAPPPSVAAAADGAGRDSASAASAVVPATSAAVRTAASSSSSSSSSTTTILARPLREFVDLVEGRGFCGCCFGHDGEWVVGAAGTRGAFTVFVWDGGSGALVRQFDGAAPGKPRRALAHLGWHPHRPLLLAATVEGPLQVWGCGVAWAAFAPEFEEIEENEVYAEAEDEFDEVVAGVSAADASPAEAVVAKVSLAAGEVGGEAGNGGGSKSGSSGSVDEVDLIDVVGVKRAAAFDSDSEGGGGGGAFVVRARVASLLPSKLKQKSLAVDAKRPRPPRMQKKFDFH